MMRHALLVALALAAGLVAGCGGGDAGSTATTSADAGGPLVVSAAASLTEALEQYGGQFDDGQVRYSFAGSDELAAQIRQGVKPDVFASANTTLPDALHQEGIVGQAARVRGQPPRARRPRRRQRHRLDRRPRPATASSSPSGRPRVPIGAYTRKVLDRLPAATRDKDRWPTCAARNPT